jgi:hypothetical protein
VFICHKLIENGLLVVLSVLLLVGQASPGCLRYHWVKPGPQPAR